MIGISVFGWLADRAVARLCVLTFQIGAAVMIVIYSRDQPTALLFGGFFMGMFANGMIGGYGTLIAELFPTEVRGHGADCAGTTPAASSAARRPRLSSRSSPPAGFGFAIGCVACIYVVAFIAMFFLPEKKGSDLE